MKIELGKTYNLIDRSGLRIRKVMTINMRHLETHQITMYLGTDGIWYDPKGFSLANPGYRLREIIPVTIYI